MSSQTTTAPHGPPAPAGRRRRRAARKKLTRIRPRTQIRPAPPPPKPLPRNASPGVSQPRAPHRPTARTTTHTPNTTACRGVAIPLSATHPHGGFLTEDERQYVKDDAVATIRSCNRTIVTTTTEQLSNHMKRGMRHYASSGPTTLNRHRRRPASAVIRPSQTTILRKYSDFMQGYNSIAQENIHVA
ncbi:hypothetical protein BIFDEN_01001 [Bifidobacterium dentium ATCC 27678]|nr:hypothetical protein BIFDEN_01001 [Bifidobacterium dentium ATCC 27678]